MKHAVRNLLAAIAVCFAGGAAADPGDRWYFFLGAAQMSAAGAPSKDANDAELAASGSTVTGSRESNRDRSLIPGVGYRFTRNLAVEAGIAELQGGMHRYSAEIASGQNSGLSQKEWSGYSFQVAAVGTLPIGRWFSVLGKAGVAALKAEHRDNTILFGSPPTPGAPRPVVFQSDVSFDSTRALPVLGVGAAIGPEDFLQLRVMFERWRTKAGMFGPGNDLNHVEILSVTLVAAF